MYPVPGQVLCPRCGCPHSTAVNFTWWGGVLGPKLLNHVECTHCRHAFNGKTGQSNTTGIIIYSVVTGMIALVILVLLVLLKVL